MKEYQWWWDPCMWGLGLYSVLALAFILERVIAWVRIHGQHRELANRIQELLVHPNRDELKQACAGSDAPLADVVEHVLKHEVEESPETTLLLLDDSLDEAGSRMKKNLVFLAAIGKHAGRWCGRKNKPRRRRAGERPRPTERSRRQWTINGG